MMMKMMMLLNSYLDKFNANDKSKLDVEFDWLDGKRYTVLSDIIFINKPICGIRKI